MTGNLYNHIDKMGVMPVIKHPYADIYIWALSLAPLWGSLVQVLIAWFFVWVQGIPGNDPVLGTELYDIAFREQMDNFWFVVLLCNVGFSILDERHLSEIENQKTMEKSTFLLVIIVPFYIFNRDKMRGAGMTRFWIWVGSFIISAYLF